MDAANAQTKKINILDSLEWNKNRALTESLERQSKSITMKRGQKVRRRVTAPEKTGSLRTQIGKFVHNPIPFMKSMCKSNHHHI